MSEVTAPIMTDATGQSIDSKLNSLLGKMDNLAAAFQPNASGIVYSNTTSGLTGDDVQEAIDEMAADVSEIKQSLSNFTTYSTSSDRVLIGTKQGKPLYRQYLTYSNVTVATNTDKTLTSASIPEGADNITVSDKSYIQSGTLRLNANCGYSCVYTNARTLIWRQLWSSSSTWSLYLWVEYTLPN